MTDTLTDEEIEELESLHERDKITVVYRRDDGDYDKDELFKKLIAAAKELNELKKANQLEYWNNDALNEQERIEFQDEVIEAIKRNPAIADICFDDDGIWRPWMNAQGLLTRLITAEKREKELRERYKIDELEEKLGKNIAPVINDLTSHGIGFLEYKPTIEDVILNLDDFDPDKKIEL